MTWSDQPGSWEEVEIKDRRTKRGRHRGNAKQIKIIKESESNMDNTDDDHTTKGSSRRRPILRGNVKCIRRARPRLFGYGSRWLKLKRFRLRLCAIDWYWLIMWVIAPSVGASKVVYSKSKRQKNFSKEYMSIKRETLTAPLAAAARALVSRDQRWLSAWYELVAFQP